MYWYAKKRIKALFLLPTLLVYVLFIILPVGIALYYSLMKYSGIGAPVFIGLKNYARLLNDRLVWVALKNTTIILVMNLVLLTPISFMVAVLFCKPLRASGFSKAMIYSPAIIAPIMVGLLWLFILDPRIGLLNSILEATGLGAWKQDWIGGTVLTPYSVGIIYMWQTMGFYLTIFYAGLKIIPSEIYQAASVDGANARQRLFSITIPLMRGTIWIVVVLIVTGCFKIFETVYQLTNGSPNHLSEVLVTYMYHTTFVSSEYGYGMAIAMFTFLLTMAGSIGYIRANVKRGV